MGLFNHENLQVSCHKDKKTCRFIKGFRKLICSISESKRILKGRLIRYDVIPDKVAIPETIPESIAAMPLIPE